MYVDIVISNVFNLNIYIFSGAAFNRVSHCGLFFKLKSIGVGGSVLSNCTEFLSDRRQRAASVVLRLMVMRVCGPQ